MPLKIFDLAVVTGPLRLEEEEGYVFLEEGEVVKLVGADDEGGDVLVFGLSSHLHQYIAASSLTPLSEVQDDPEVGWGDLLDPNYVHDFVGEEAADV